MKDESLTKLKMQIMNGECLIILIMQVTKGNVLFSETERLNQWMILNPLPSFTTAPSTSPIHSPQTQGRSDEPEWHQSVLDTDMVYKQHKHVKEWHA